MNDELKRMRMRSWRRGTKEMDLILGPFADTELAGLDADTQMRFDALLDENDHDLYLWITARLNAPPHPDPAPEGLRDLLGVIARHARARLGPA
jgi:antitoxin CptB